MTDDPHTVPAHEHAIELCGAHQAGALAGCTLPASHLEHRDRDGDRWTDPLALRVPAGFQNITYDPRVLNAYTVDRDLPGFVAASGNTVRVFRDDAPGDEHTTLTPAERAVLVARLRHWADALEAGANP